jgi:hypothetical protein
MYVQCCIICLMFFPMMNPLRFHLVVSCKDCYAHNKVISIGRHSLIIVHSNCDSMYTQACIFIYIPWPRSDKPVYIPHNKPLTCIQIRQTQLLTNNKHTVVEYMVLKLMCYFFPTIITRKSLL